MYFFRIFIAVLCLLMAGCTTSSNNGFQHSQAGGYKLDPVRAASRSTNLSSYIVVMCQDSYFSNGTNCPDSLTSNQHSKLLLAGFNEIGAGCEDYLQFIFDWRQSDRQVRGLATALRSFIGGILTLEGSPARLFSYLILGSTLSENYYEATRIDPLSGMTYQNIDKIIQMRHRAFEAEVSGKAIKDMPTVVRLWERYQLVCSPRKILLDFNASAAAGLGGAAIDFDADAKREVARAFLTPLSANTRIDRPTNLARPTGQTCTGREKVFSDNPKNYSCKDVFSAQRLLCFAEGRGLDSSGGAKTTAAIKLWELSHYTEAQRSADAMKTDGLLSEFDMSELGGSGCTISEAAVYQNVYEKIQFQGNPGTFESYVNNLNNCFPNEAAIPAGTTFENAGAQSLRARIAKFRTEAKVEADLGGQITPTLRQAIVVASSNNCAAVKGEN